ncbi:hypothetical protein BsubNA05_30620 [Bacillus subtilis]|nr:hypothetical protein BsubNA05_30620 [Bacillus subtilis]
MQHPKQNRQGHNAQHRTDKGHTRNNLDSHCNSNVKPSRFLYDIGNGENTETP